MRAKDDRKGETRDGIREVRAMAPTAADAWDELEAPLDQRVTSRATTDLSLRHPVNISPWLVKNGWTTHLRGREIWTVVGLSVLPTPSEARLVAFLSTFDELIKDAKASILSRR